MDQDKIGKFIAKLRKDKNITQEELAEKLGVNSKSISRWETGKCMPDLSLLVPLSKELGMSVNDLLSGKKNDKEAYQEAFEENIVNIVSKVDKDNKKRRLKTIWISLSIIFIIIPLFVLCIGQFFKADLFPSFSSLKIMNKANRFYEALQNNDIDKIDKLMTDNVKDEMCWYTTGDYQTKQNFLDNLQVLKEFKYKVEYTSFKVKQFGYRITSVEGWEITNDSDDPNTVSVFSCSPSRGGFIVTYELCFKDRESRACIALDFLLDDDGRLIFHSYSGDINMSEDLAYKKYYPIYYPLSANNAFYNPLHVFVEGVFYGYKLETIEENVDSWLNR